MDLREEINKDNIQYYKDLKIEDVEEALLELMDKKVNERIFSINTGKQGVLHYLKILYESFGFSENKTFGLLQEAELKLKDGWYTINEKGIIYHD